MTKYECMEWLFSHFDETENNLLSLPCMIEEWKDIEGYEGLYQVSNLGRVKSVERTIEHPLNGHKRIKERILKPRFNRYGYPFVDLYSVGTSKIAYIHRLVANAFIPNPDNLPEVNHKDENPSNNMVDNLEWCGRKYNINYGTRNQRHSKKLTNYQLFSKKVLCIEKGLTFPSAAEAERWLSKNSSRVNSCCRGETKTAYGYHWKYI